MSSNKQTHSDHHCLSDIAVYLLCIGDPKDIKRMTRVWALVIYESINFEYLINHLSNCGYKVELTAFFSPMSFAHERSTLFLALYLI